MFKEKKQPRTKLDTAGLADLQDLLDYLIGDNIPGTDDLLPLRRLLYEGALEPHIRMEMVKVGLRLIYKERKTEALDELQLLKSTLDMEAKAAAVERTAKLKKKELEVDAIDGDFWMREKM